MKAAATMPTAARRSKKVGVRFEKGPEALQSKEDLRRGVRDVCARFPNDYWRDLDAGAATPKSSSGR